MRRLSFSLLAALVVLAAPARAQAPAPAQASAPSASAPAPESASAPAPAAASSPAPVARAEGLAPLELEWCIGSMPASWGFAVTPSETCSQVHVRTRSAAVLMLAAKGGPGLPADWKVELLDEREARASGPTPLAPGPRLETFFIIDTNRSTGSVDARGALPVEWGIWFADAAGAPTSSGKMTASFPPVLPLTEAAAKGMVLLTCEGLGPVGPVEVTVDNPTWYPVWLDLPTGTVLTADGRDWVVASSAPFRMMRKQKTGRTLTAFPLVPSLVTTTPKRLVPRKAAPSDALNAARELAIAAKRLQDAARSGARAPGGAFERASPWDFWPVALRWATWKATATPPAELLGFQVAKLIMDRATAGDPVARGLDPVAATAEVEAASAAIAAEALTLRTAPLPIEQLAAKERFR